jgi:hypothetical protein
VRFLAGYVEHFGDGEVIPLVDGEPLLAREGFWAAYYFAQGMCVEEDGDIVFPSFEVSEEIVHEALGDLADPEAWPVFTVPVSDSAEICVVARNYAEDYGFDYLVCREGLEPSIQVAALEGCGYGPGISWHELRGIVDRAPDPLRRAQAMLLLAPMYGDADHVEEACSAFEQALASVGGNRDSGRLAEYLGSDGVEGQPTWRHDEKGVLWREGRGPGPRSTVRADWRTERLNALVSDILAPGDR